MANYQNYDETDLKIKLNNIEQKLNQLDEKARRKDIWDIIGIVSSFLIPLSIFLASYFLTKSEKKQQKIRAKTEIRLAEIESKVKQADVLHSFFNDLLDTDTTKQRLAMESIVLAMPDEGLEIVKILPKLKVGDKKQRKKTKALVNNFVTAKTIRKLTAEMFSENANISSSAKEELLVSYKDEVDLLVSRLINLLKKVDYEAPELKSHILINAYDLLLNIDMNAISLKKLRSLRRVSNWANEIENEEVMDLQIRLIDKIEDLVADKE